MPPHAHPAPHPPRRHPAGAGFTLVEVLVALTVLALLAATALPAMRGQDQRAGRMDGMEALTRVQQAQEQYRSHHGLYAGDLSALAGTARLSPQGRYDISLAVNGESYLATATARGAQAGDTACPTIVRDADGLGARGRGDGVPGPRARARAWASIAMYDAFVACWEAKFHYWLARPITVEGPGARSCTLTSPKSMRSRRRDR